MKMLNQIEFFIRFRCRGEFSSVTIAATDVFAGSSGKISVSGVESASILVLRRTFDMYLSLS